MTCLIMTATGRERERWGRWTGRLKERGREMGYINQSVSLRHWADLGAVKTQSKYEDRTRRVL